MAISKHLLYWLFSSTRYQSAPRLVLNSGLSSLTVLFRPRSLKMSYKLLLLLLLLSRLSCPTLCDPIDGSPPGSPAPGILHARTLEWVAISFSNAWKWKVKVKLLSRALLLATPWTAASQAPLSTDFPGKNTGVGCHCLLRKNSIIVIPLKILHNRNKE